MKNIDIKQQILDLLFQNLREVPSVRDISFALDKTVSQAGPEIEVDTYRDIHRIIVEIRNNGQPRYARDAIAQLLLKSSRSAENTYPVFAAPFISKSAADICLEAGTGYIDLAGNCRLAFNGIYIERQGQPNRFVSKRSLRSLYQTRSSRVLRALLFDPKLTWKLTDLSTAAGVSIGQVFNVKKALVDREWAVFEKDGLCLTQPETIIRDWGKHYTYQEDSLFHFHSSASPSEMESRLSGLFSEKGLRYALTSLSGSARLTPTVEQTGVFAYIDTDIDNAADLLQLKPTELKPNVTLMLPYDEGVFFGMREIEGVNMVSPIQTYLDLIALKEVGKEAAEVLFTQVIQKEWQ